MTSRKCIQVGNYNMLQQWFSNFSMCRNHLVQGLLNLGPPPEILVQLVLFRPGNLLGLGTWFLTSSQVIYWGSHIESHHGRRTVKNKKRGKGDCRILTFFRCEWNEPSAQQQFAQMKRKVHLTVDCIRSQLLLVLATGLFVMTLKVIRQKNSRDGITCKST